jgi:peptide subunit release factor RF-3
MWGRALSSTGCWNNEKRLWTTLRALPVIVSTVMAEWTGKNFNVIDTGGFVPRSEDIFEREIRKQVLIAVKSKRFIIYVDAATGITDLA